MDKHFVKFYEDEALLTAQVGDFIGAGLEHGGAGIVVATKPHRDAFEEYLRTRGRIGDIAGSEAPAYLALDATEALSAVMVDGWPQEKAYADFFGKIIGDASQGGRRHVRIFGEMSAVLLEAGDEDAAIRLEELGNGLEGAYSVSILCAYPIQTVIGKHCSSLIRVCAEHTGVGLPESLWTSVYIEAAPWPAANEIAPLTAGAANSPL